MGSQFLTNEEINKIIKSDFKTEFYDKLPHTNAIVVDFIYDDSKKSKMSLLIPKKNFAKFIEASKEFVDSNF